MSVQLEGKGAPTTAADSIGRGINGNAICFGPEQTTSRDDPVKAMNDPAAGRKGFIKKRPMVNLVKLIKSPSWPSFSSLIKTNIDGHDAHPGFWTIASIK